MNFVREAHTSLIAGHFGVRKTGENFQRYFNWTHMLEILSCFIKGCSLCVVSKPSNRKLGLDTPLMVPSCRGESISMDFVGGLPMSRKGCYRSIWAPFPMTWLN